MNRLEIDNLILFLCLQQEPTKRRAHHLVMNTILTPESPTTTASSTVLYSAVREIGKFFNTETKAECATAANRRHFQFS